MREELFVPIEHRPTITIDEAASYTGIGQHKIRELLKIPNCPFVLFVGNKQLVKREEFVEYLRKNYKV